MALYRIRLDHSTKGAITVWEVRRSDAAMLKAERLAYDAVAANAWLDTLAGCMAMDKVQAIDPHKGGTVVIGNYVLCVTKSIPAMKPRAY